MKRMVTTRDITAPELGSDKRLTYKTTAEVDVSPPVVKPEDMKKPDSPIVSTTNLGNLEDEAEKRKRAEIMAQREALKAETIDSEIDVENDKGFNLQYSIVEIDDLLQGIPRRELK